MYDTLHMWLDRDLVRKTDYLTKLPYLMNNPSEHHFGDLIWISGNYRNLKIGLSEKGISIKGSLAKYYINDSLGTLSRGDSERAIDNLSDHLGLKIKNSNVTRIDN